MKLDHIFIDVVSGDRMRAIAAKLIKSNNTDNYLVFVQKVDPDLSFDGGVINAYFRKE